MAEEIYDKIIFLDFDGVINIDTDDLKVDFQNTDAIKYLNKLCLETGFSIVVCSSWRNHMNYKEFLRASGLDERIQILGKTSNSNSGKEFEIRNFINEHKIDKYIIIDDAYFGGDLIPHHVQTASRLGFTENKYLEALDKISKL